MKKSKVRFIRWLIRALLPGTHHLSLNPPKGRRKPANVVSKGPLDAQNAIKDAVLEATTEKDID